MTTQPSNARTNETAEDLALSALSKCFPNIQPNAAHYGEILDGLIAMCQHLGIDKFKLYYNLRPPADRAEEWSRDYYQQRITKEELGNRLREDAERPIDLEMLTKLHDALEANAVHYSGILQKSVILPSEDSRQLRDRRTAEINEHVSQLKERLPLWIENLETVFDFLDEVRISSNLGLEKLGEFEATSAHWLAQLLFQRIAQAWDACTDLANRSRRNHRYLYATDAIDTFREHWLPKFPPPQNLSERLRYEFKLARRTLTTTASPSDGAATPILQSSALTTPTSGEIDNESRELILIGELSTIVGQAGHIFRPFDRFDWGVDGEIEFKDESGFATGSKLYVQLKSGDSYLTRRKSDGAEIFRIPKKRHPKYWANHAYPVFLVIRQSTGLIRWMDVRRYALKHGTAIRQIPFQGEVLDVQAVRNLAKLAIDALPPENDK